MATNSFFTPHAWDWRTISFAVLEAHSNANNKPPDRHLCEEQAAQSDATDHVLTEGEDPGVDTYALTQPDLQKDEFVVAFRQSLGNFRFGMSRMIFDSLFNIADKSNKPFPGVVMLFGPYVLDCINAWIARNGRVPHRCTSFEQRVKYFNEISRLDVSRTWYPGILEAANTTIGYLLDISLLCVREMAESEKGGLRGDSVREDSGLQHIRAELGDADLRKALDQIAASSQQNKANAVGVERQWTVRLFHRLDCILLLETILREQSIQQGISSPKATSLGKSIISSCRRNSLRSPHNSTYLLLGGVTLSSEKDFEGKQHLR